MNTAHKSGLHAQIIFPDAGVAHVLHPHLNIYWWTADIWLLWVDAAKRPVKVGIRFHEWSIMSHYHFCVRDTEAAKRSAQLKYSLGLQSIYNSSHITPSISGLSWFLPRIFSFPNDWLCGLPSVTDFFDGGRRQGVPHLAKPRLHPPPPPQ